VVSFTLTLQVAEALFVGSASDVAVSVTVV
jgi:hypothetical protein